MISPATFVLEEGTPNRITTSPRSSQTGPSSMEKFQSAYDTRVRCSSRNSFRSVAAVGSFLRQNRAGLGEQAALVGAPLDELLDAKAVLLPLDLEALLHQVEQLEEGSWLRFCLRPGSLRDRLLDRSRRLRCRLLRRGCRLPATQQ